MQNWLEKHPVFCSIMKQLHDEHEHPVDDFAALADFKLLVGKARTRARQELLRSTLQAMVPNHMAIDIWLRENEVVKHGNQLGDVAIAPHSSASTFKQWTIPCARK